MIKEPSVLLSFIIPVYNGEKYIERCIQSIIKSCNKNLDLIEIIVINDGSSDHTKDVLQPYLEKDYFFYIEQENSGVSVARNNGLLHARGKYITFVDADDYIDQSYFESLYPEMKKEVEMICFNFYYAKEKQNVLALPLFSEDLYLEKNAGINDYLLDDLEKRISASPCNKIYRRDKIETHELRFLKGKSMSEDLMFNAHYLQRITSIRFLDKGLYYYVYNSQSIMHSYNASYVGSVLGFIPEVIELCRMYDVEIDHHKITRMVLNRWFGVVSNQVRSSTFTQGYQGFQKFIQDSYFKKNIKKLPNSILTMKQMAYKYITIFHLSSLVYILVYGLNKRKKA